jgi:hypothetical protein
MILNPSLASQAPNVSRIKAVAGVVIEATCIVDGMNRTSLSIIPSKHRSDIRRWELLNRNDMVVNENAIRDMV